MSLRRVVYFLILSVASSVLLYSCVPESSNNSVALKKSSGAVGGGSVFMSIISEESWTITIDYEGDQKDWITIKPSSGSGNRNSVIVTYTENKAEESRKAAVKVSFSKEIISLPFTQYGTASLLEGGPGTILPPQDEFPQLESDVVPGWMELPAVKPGYGCAWVYHNMTFRGSSFRNYSIYYDASNKMAHWVAYPLNSSLIGSGGRTDLWEIKDPKIPYSYQPYTERGWGVGSYDRGHMVPSGDRLINDAANNQTFYPTNVSVQLGRNFNQSIWADLEGRVRSWARSCDTLYVVTGAVPSENKYITDRAGNRVNVPKAYYKALLQYKSSSPASSRYTGIAFYLVHEDYTASGGTDPWASVLRDNALSISDLESVLGMNFFINLPEESQRFAEESFTPSYWGL